MERTCLLYTSLCKGVDIGMRGGVQRIVTEKSHHIGAVDRITVADQKIPQSAECKRRFCPVQLIAIFLERFSLHPGEIAVAKEKIRPLRTPIKGTGVQVFLILRWKFRQYLPGKLIMC